MPYMKLLVDILIRTLHSLLFRYVQDKWIIPLSSRWKICEIAQ